MAEKPRSRAAKLRASHGRAERLRREAGDTRQPSAPRKERDPARADRTGPAEARPAPARRYGKKRYLTVSPEEAATYQRIPATRQGEPSTRVPALSKAARVHGQDRKSTLPHRIEERLERARAGAERRRLQRLEKLIRSEFDRAGERRRDTGRRAEVERKREALQQKERRLQDHRRRADLRRLERRRGELKRQLNLAADRRQDLARRAELDRRKALEDARQKALQQRAAAEIEREQKRRVADQQTAQRFVANSLRHRQLGERNSFRVNEAEVEHRHHNAIKGLDDRKDRELSEFDGRRRGLVGRIAELVPGRRAENDRQRAAIETRYETETWNKHRDFEAFKERSFAAEQKKRIEHFQELKALRALHGEERSEFGLQQTQDRPRLVEERVRMLLRADQDREQAREREQARPDQTQEADRPSNSFNRATSGHPAEPASSSADFSRDASREVLRPAWVLERA